MHHTMIFNIEEAVTVMYSVYCVMFGELDKFHLLAHNVPVQCSAPQKTVTIETTV